jgi:hypothetical protein
MAINKNHEFEDLDGVKCAIVEKNVSNERTEFLRQLLVYNGYTVIIQTSPVPKAAAAPIAVPDQPVVEEEPVAPETYTVGVTDVMFNAINAIFGRLLKTPENRVVTLAYWKQQEEKADDEIPYFEKTF